MRVTPQNITILGLGVSGMEAARLAVRLGHRVLVQDEADNATLRERAETLRSLGVQVELGSGVESFGKADEAVVSPGIDLSSTLVRRWSDAETPIIGEFEFAWRSCTSRTVAITGTNGKTTTTELVTSILNDSGARAVAAGNIGKAFSSVVNTEEAWDWIVLEVSSFQLESVIQFRPDVGIYLNLTPDHLDRYGRLEDYAKAKERLFANQTEKDVAVVNASLKLEGLRAKTVTFNTQGIQADFEMRGRDLYGRGEKLFSMNEAKLMGRHNAENMLAAIAAAEACGVSRAVAIKSVTSYAPRPNRCEPVAEIDGVLYVNDSKGTNLDAVVKALEALDRPSLLIAGGKDKGLDFAEIKEAVGRYVKKAILIGETREGIRKAWSEIVPCVEAENLESAVEMAAASASPGDVVLLSPGCSSFDMFRNYEHRGEVFRHAVMTRIKPQTNTQEK